MDFHFERYNDRGDAEGRTIIHVSIHPLFDIVQVRVDFLND